MLRKGWTVMYDVQNPVAPWGDSNQCCGQGSTGLWAWIAANPWLAAALALGALVLMNSGKRT
jgi:hypothetical protein